MPTEVLVMCKRCGRPQQAGAGRCAACGGELPDAPLPPPVGATSTERFLSAELPGGRVLAGEGNRLSFRPGPSATPFLLELPGLRRLSLVHRPRYEALALTAVVVVLLPFVSRQGPRVLLGLLALVGLALAFLSRRYTLVLESAGQVETRWELGTVRRGSSQEQRLRSVWRTLAEVVRSRGVKVSEPPV
ncbi:hypothetical protein [Archangium violaceum]|uniref:Uncharacterized protein n=1 Tax=Archangium violaceum Cb vi76 TaxID=1406225 RepID=A0A084SI76_9BACT|nr:hypothetical protein [Archangium violaceum]KFA88161.1 hypothetical protein Q664_43020 [Archangium violaceum Cb vi76]